MGWIAKKYWNKHLTSNYDTKRLSAAGDEYWNVKKHPDSLILSAKDRQGNRLETVEVNIKTWSIVQSRGLLNDPSEHHDEIIELVKQNMNKLKIA